METATVFKIILFLTGCLLLPIVGGMLERRLDGLHKYGLIGMFLGSLVALMGFGYCVSWNCICQSSGNCTAFLVFLIAWITFLFLSFSAYSTQLKH